MIKFTGDLRCDFEKAAAEITKLKDRILGYQEKVASLQTSIKRLKRSKESDKKQYTESLAEKDAIIKELQNRLAHAEALLNHDGSNTGTPTSQTPINKNKVIPNSRRSSGKPKGGQTGHPKASLEVPDESGITDTAAHPLQDDECSPKCSLTDCTPTGESEVKYEYDIQIKVVKIKHEFFYYECNNCGTVFRSQIPPNLKEKVQYGSGIQAFALSLTNTVNAAMNKAAMFLAGITGGGLTPPGSYGAAWERTLLTRISKYRILYFRWVEDFSLPTTNNLSERGLRGIKSHMKISGQFESEAAADNHALIRTYIETCRRNDINEIAALQRLCEGNLYMVSEIFSTSPP